MINMRIKRFLCRNFFSSSKNREKISHVIINIFVKNCSVFLIIENDLDTEFGIFLENDFWTQPPPLLSILYMGLTGTLS